MKREEKIKLFNDVFAPKPGEKILFLVDKPHDNINDNKKWSERRKMAKEWYETFKEMGKEKTFSVEHREFNATGLHNTILSEDLCDYIKTYDLVIAMTEYSASSTLFNICKKKF